MEEETIVEAGEGIEGGDKGVASDSKAWLTSVPEEFRGNEAITSLESSKDVYKRLVELTEKGKGSITIPGEKATDEERAAFYKAIGRPEAPDKYTFSKPEGLPEDITYDPNIETAFKQEAFAKGLNDTQAKELYNWYYGLVAEGAKQQAEATEKALDTLKSEWKGDTFKANTDIAVKAFKEFGAGNEEFLEKVVDGVKIGNHPGFLKIFAAIGKAMSDDKATFGNEGGGGEPSRDQIVKAWFPMSPDLHKK